MGGIINFMKTENKVWEITYTADRKTLQKAIELDAMVFNSVDVGDIERCMSWVEKEPQIYTFLWLNKRLIGYINLMPLASAAYKKVLSGKLRDFRIDEKDIKAFRRGENKCLFTSIVVHPKYRDGEAILHLWKGLVDKVNSLKNKGVDITKVVADCVSVDGIKYMVNNFKSRYICNSTGGKIYEGEFFNMSKLIPHLQLEEISKNNVKIAGKMQYDIFNKYEEVGYLDFKAEAKTKNRFKKKILPLTYLAYLNCEPVGFVGLYEYEEYPDDIWINWLGVREDKRRQGIATQLLFKIVEIARQYNKKNLRIQTYSNLNIEAQSIYRKLMQIVEPYTNKKDNKFNQGAEVVIYSLSLQDKIAPRWRNKFIDINDEYRLHCESVLELKKDGVI